VPGVADGPGHPKGLAWGHEIGIGPFLVSASERLASITGVSGR
jgi:hypothetical protein